MGLAANQSLSDKNFVSLIATKLMKLVSRLTEVVEIATIEMRIFHAYTWRLKELRHNILSHFFDGYKLQLKCWETLK